MSDSFHSRTRSAVLAMALASVRAFAWTPVAVTNDHLIRMPGINPLTGEPIEHDERTFPVEAGSRKRAYKLAVLINDMPMNGAVLKVFIDGKAYYFDEED